MVELNMGYLFLHPPGCIKLIYVNKTNFYDISNNYLRTASLKGVWTQVSIFGVVLFMNP